MKQNLQRTIFSFFGPPGSGKGTLAQKLAERRGFHVLSTGNLCRQHMSMGTEIGKKIQQYVDQGHLIPDELITDMVVDWLITQSQDQGAVILDGFPRTQGQASRFIDFLKQNTSKYLFRCVFIEVPDEEIVRRLSHRLVCSNKSCQAPVMGGLKLTNCPLCNAILMRRADDREEIVRERLSLYPAYRSALLGYYQNVGQVVEHLPITGLDPEQVYERFITLMDKK